MEQKSGISVVIITRPHEEYLPRSIASVSWADEVVLIYDKSVTEDKTLQDLDAIPKSKNIRQFDRNLNGDFAQQRNFGLAKALYEWVLFVDSDEVISEKLATEIQSKIVDANTRVNGYFLKRSDFFMGKWLQHGETNAQSFLRLARKNCGKWVGPVHERWNIIGRLEYINCPIKHYPHKSLFSFLHSLNVYTDILSDIRYQNGEIISVWHILLYPLGKFLHNYFIRFGFLDGMPGLIMALMMSFHSFLVRAKLWQKQNQKTST